MKKENLYKFLGIFMILISIILGMIAFYKENFNSIWFVFTFTCWIVFLAYYRKLKKWFKFDELSKKVWYTAYAFSNQMMMFLSGIFIVVNRYFNFLPEIVENTIAIIITLQLFFTFIAFFYYSKNPDKTGL